MVGMGGGAVESGGTGSRWRLGAGAAVVLVLGAVAGGVVQQVAQDVAPPPVAVSAEAVAPSAASLIVDVQGAVASPGVYSLPQGARVLDAIARAGGAAEGAAPGGLNLARPVVDGEQLLVPTEEEAAAAATAAPGGGTSGGLVSLNRADAATLETLPRVGPALAGAILAHRDEHGPFTAVEQLDDVPGIGPALLAQLTPLVTL